MIDDSLSFYTPSLRQIPKLHKVLMANSDPLFLSEPLLGSLTLPKLELIALIVTSGTTLCLSQFATLSRSAEKRESVQN